MQIGVGYEFIYEFPQPTPLLLTVHIHAILVPQTFVTADHLVTCSFSSSIATRSVTGSAGLSLRRG